MNLVKASLRPDRLALLELILLVPQFLLGMATNLYVQISNPGVGAVPLVAHIVLGSLLVLIGLLLLVVGISSRQPRWQVSSIVGAVGLLGAWGGGFSFVLSGQNLSSMIMASSFILAMAAYGTGLFLELRR